jgi:putative component of membrane protein insertase Oxa1/YidC/SpoIIIJ protein YidD
MSDLALYRLMIIACSRWFPACSSTVRAAVDASVLALAVPQQKRERRIMRCVPRHRLSMALRRFRYLRAAEEEQAVPLPVFWLPSSLIFGAGCSTHGRIQLKRLLC